MEPVIKGKRAATQLCPPTCNKVETTTALLRLPSIPRPAGTCNKGKARVMQLRHDKGSTRQSMAVDFEGARRLISRIQFGDIKRVFHQAQNFVGCPHWRLSRSVHSQTFQVGRPPTDAWQGFCREMSEKQLMDLWDPTLSQWHGFQLFWRVPWCLF